MDTSTLGGRIRLAAVRTKRTQKAIAKAAGITPQALTDMIAGRRMGRASLSELATALEVPLSWLLDGSNAPAWAETAKTPPPPPKTVDALVELYSRRLADFAAECRAKPAAKVTAAERAQATEAMNEFPMDPPTAAQVRPELGEYESLSQLVGGELPRIILDFESMLALIYAARRTIDDTSAGSDRVRRILSVLIYEWTGWLASPDDTVADKDGGYERVCRWSTQVVEAQRGFERACGSHVERWTIDYARSAAAGEALKNEYSEKPKRAPKGRRASMKPEK